MKWYFLMMIAIFACMALVEIFAPKNTAEECTYIRSEELMVPDLVITVGIKGMENDTDYVYRVQ